MSESEDFDRANEIARMLRLCACGCAETEHDDAGRCVFCGDEGCQGFTYDDEGTVLALAHLKSVEDIP